MKNNSAKLIEGEVGKVIFKMTIPMVFAILGMVLFHLTDTFFISKLGKDQLAAITFTFPVVLFFNSIGLGIGTGGSAVISRAIGEGDIKNVRRLTTDSLILILIISIIAVGAGLLTIDFLFTALGATPEVLFYIKEYMLIWYPGSILVMIPMVGNNVIRATGDTKTPGLIMLFSAMVNLALDPIFIFGWGFIPAYGMAGAATATVIARGGSCIIALYILSVRENMLTIQFPGINETLKSWSKILIVAIPTSVSRILLPVGAGIITRLISVYGMSAVAAFGIGTRIEFFVLAPIAALVSVVGPFVGQNAGAKKIDRIQKAISVSNKFAIIWGIVTWGILVLFAPHIISIFSSDQMVIDVGEIFLWIMPIGFGLISVMRISVAALNVLHKPLLASGINLLQIFVLYVPLAYLFSRSFGLKGIFIAFIISSFISGALAEKSIKVEVKKLLD